MGIDTAIAVSTASHPDTISLAPAAGKLENEMDTALHRQSTERSSSLGCRRERGRRLAAATAAARVSEQQEEGARRERALRIYVRCRGRLTCMRSSTVRSASVRAPPLRLFVRPSPSRPADGTSRAHWSKMFCGTLSDSGFILTRCR